MRSPWILKTVEIGLFVAGAVFFAAGIALAVAPHVRL
jgi:hypothetical protein